MDLLRQFNKYSNDQRSLVQKAMLTAATGVGEALIPQHLEKIITNLAVRLAPEIAMITPRYDAQKYHEFNRLTTLPAAGGAMGEGAVTPTRASVYQRTGRNLKVVRRKGAVTNFLQDSSKNYIDASAVEMENHIQSHVYDLVTYINFGNDNADPYTYPGLDYLTVTNRYNAALGGVVPVDLTLLDAMIDENTARQGANHRKAFMMSPQMLSLFSRLLTNVRVNQGVVGNGLTYVDIPGGWRLSAYRDIPIIQSTQCRPTGTAMGTVTPSVAGAGSGLGGAATIYGRIAAITWGGEQIASAQFTQALGTADYLTLTFAAYSGAMYYKVYISNTQNSEVLVKMIPANLYDADGTIGAAVTSCRFSSNPAVRDATVDQLNGAGLVSPLVLTSTVPLGQAGDRPLIQTGGVSPEYIFFWDLDEFQGMGKFAYTNSAGSRFNGLITLEPLAKTDDNLPFLVKTYGSMIDSWEATGYVARGLRAA